MTIMWRLKRDEWRQEIKRLEGMLWATNDPADKEAFAAALAAPPAGISPAVKTAVLDMGNAGALLSNCAFNLAQHKGNLIDQRTAETLDECRKGWDAAWSNLRAALSQGDVSGEGEGA